MNAGFFVAVACLLSCSLVAAEPLRPDDLVKIGFEQKLDQQLTLDLKFRDEHGESVRLGDYLGKKPMILVLGYYECPMLCSVVLNGLVESLGELRLDVGRDFDVVFVSIEPKEQPALAAAKKQMVVRRYGRPRTVNGWHFLTGDAVASSQLASEVGFGHAWDPVARQHAHPSGFIVVTPQGRVARYFFGVRFPAKDLHSAIAEAAGNRIGSPIQRMLLLCFHYSPLTGKYGALVMNGVRAGAIATVLGIGLFIVRASRRKEATE